MWVASPLYKTEGQSASNYGIGQVCLLIFFIFGKMIAAKTNQLIVKCAVLWFLTAKHYSAATMYQELCTVYAKKLKQNWFIRLKVSEQTLMRPATSFFDMPVCHHMTTPPPPPPSGEQSAFTL